MGYFNNTVWILMQIFEKSLRFKQIVLFIYCLYIIYIMYIFYIYINIFKKQHKWTTVELWKQWNWKFVVLELKEDLDFSFNLKIYYFVTVYFFLFFHFPLIL